MNTVPGSPKDNHHLGWSAKLLKLSGLFSQLFVDKAPHKMLSFDNHNKFCKCFSLSDNESLMVASIAYLHDFTTRHFKLF